MNVVNHLSLEEYELLHNDIKDGNVCCEAVDKNGDQYDIKGTVLIPLMLLLMP